MGKNQNEYFFPRCKLNIYCSLNLPETFQKSESVFFKYLFSRQSWHGETAYMDFTHEFAKVHWAAFAQGLHDELPFDGIIMVSYIHVPYAYGFKAGHFPR